MSNIATLAPKWEKGQSGNPNGRPKGSKNFTTKVREALEKIADGKDYTYEEALIKSVLKNAIVDGDTSTQRLIWGYLDGLPQQNIDMAVTLPKPIMDLTDGIQQDNSDNKDSETEQED